MAKIDKRLIRLGIIIDDQISWYDKVPIEAKGMKYNTPFSGECDIMLLNIRRDARENILRNTDPRTPNRKRVSVILEVGRESYGTTTLFRGDVFRSEPTGKPDIGIRLICIVGAFNKNRLVTRSANEITKLSNIAKWIADDCGYSLSFEIPDTNIKSYSFTGSAFSQLRQLERLAKANVFVENDVLFVTPNQVERKGAVVRKLSANSGLLNAGRTDFGMKCKMLYDPRDKVGGLIDLVSETNPSANGLYTIFKLAFHVSNRAQPFYLEAECSVR